MCNNNGSYNENVNNHNENDNDNANDDVNNDGSNSDNSYVPIMISITPQKTAAAATLEDLKNRVHYGIKEELLELAQLKGIGRVRARNLFQEGFKKLNDLKFASAEDLSRVRHIGKTLAQNILTQLTGSRRTKSRLAAQEAMEFD